MILFAGCARVEYYGDLKCTKQWCLLASGGRNCRVENIPLRKGGHRTLSILATNWVPNALEVNLEGPRSPEYYLLKLQSVVFRLEFKTEDGTTAFSKMVTLADCRNRRISGSDQRVLYEILDWKEFGDLEDLQKYQIQINVLGDGGGGKRNANLVRDYILSGPDKNTEFSGTISQRETFTHEFGMFEFLLEPIEYGWVLDVREKGQDDSLARYTPPLHFLPNPRWIEGWNFRDSMNTGPNLGDVNAPQQFRAFIFSPEVGRSIQGSNSKSSLTAQEERRIFYFGNGHLQIKSIELSPPKAGEKAKIEKMSFDCSIRFR